MKKSAPKNKTKKDFKIKELAKKWLAPLSTAIIVVILSVIAVTFGRQRSLSNNQQAVSPQVEVVQNSDNVQLPATDSRSSNSIEAVLKNRRVRLDYSDASLSLKQIAQLLWAGQGINTDWGDRTAPSMKSTYPLTLYLVANKVDGLEAGEYQYLPGDRTPLNQLKPIKKTEMSDTLYDLLNQSSFKNIPAVIVVAGNMEKMAEAYGGIRHDKEVYLEAGFAAQNMALQAESLKLGTMISTNFDELKLKEIITIADTDTIIYLMPVGSPK